MTETDTETKIVEIPTVSLLRGMLHKHAMNRVTAAKEAFKKPEVRALPVEETGPRYESICALGRLLFRNRRNEGTIAGLWNQIPDEFKQVDGADIGKMAAA